MMATHVFRLVATAGLLAAGWGLLRPVASAPTTLPVTVAAERRGWAIPAVGVRHPRPLVVGALAAAVGLLGLVWARRAERGGRQAGDAPAPELLAAASPGRCPACHAAVVEEDSRFCPRCGGLLDAGLARNKEMT
jgi:hypothetical protein